MRAELVVVGIVIIIAGAIIAFYDSVTLLGVTVYPNGVAGMIIVLIGCVCSIVGFVMPTDSQSEKELATEYFSISYIEGHPKFQGKNLIMLTLKPQSLLLEPVSGSEYPMNLNIPFQSISQVSSENRRFSIDYVDVDNQKRHIIFEAEGVGVYKMPQLVSQLNNIIKKTPIDNVPTSQDATNYMDIIKLRYAKGEITKEQYEEMKKTLEQ